MTEPYRLLGVYLTPPVAGALSKRLYDDAGIIDLETYFDDSTQRVPVGDPGADATNAFLATVVSEFASLYAAADFEAATAADPDSFSLYHLGATPQTITTAREKFQAGATIQETDHRTVHTAILAAALAVDDPQTTIDS